MSAAFSTRWTLSKQSNALRVRRIAADLNKLTFEVDEILGYQ